jgi:hypothetical protein
MNIKILKSFNDPKLGLLKEGQEIEIETIDELPISQFWRNRLKDSVIDNAVEIIKTNEIIKTKKEK